MLAIRSEKAVGVVVKFMARCGIVCMVLVLLCSCGQSGGRKPSNSVRRTVTGSRVRTAEKSNPVKPAQVAVVESNKGESNPAASQVDRPKAAIAAPKRPLLQIDEAKVRRQGIRVLRGKHVTIYTDLQSTPDADQLPDVFDAAFPQWCEYFNIDPEKNHDWHVTAFIIADKTKFRLAGLLPDWLPPYEHGYSTDYYIWMNSQQSSYYLRHLLLHEGTHVFMGTMLGSCGPSWYMEGTAELLATHLWDGKRLQLNVMPSDAEHWPLWGRVKVIREARRAGYVCPIERILNYAWPPGDYVNPYAWCWAFAYLLDHHPQYRDAFRSLPPFVLEPDFNARFRQLMGSRWQWLQEQWRIYIDELDYGYDLERLAIDFTPGKPIGTRPVSVTVVVDRGWQNSGWAVRAGQSCVLEAAGRYTLADRPVPWWCEPNGITIHYWRGRPLGLLLAAIQPEKAVFDETCPFLQPTEVGLKCVIRPQQSGTLFFRINDAPHSLRDNRGNLTVTIRPVGSEGLGSDSRQAN